MAGQTGTICAWSERGPAPRRNRISHPVKHYATTGRGPHGTTPKITMRGAQKGTTRIGSTK